jgi:hypothetical protein
LDPDKLSRIARRAHLLELALAGMESFAGDSTPADPEQYFSPVRELADEVATALDEELETAR